MMFKLGRKPPTYNPKMLHFAKYLNRSTVPITVPLDVSVTAKGPLAFVNIAVMANGPDPLAPPQIAASGVGDCVFAAAVRRAALAGMSVGKQLWTSEQDMVNAALKAYAECTGWDVNNSNATDQGTDPTAAWKYLTATGLRCSDGSYDKIGAAISVNPKDIEEFLIAFNLSGGNISIGVHFPQAWESAPVWDDTTSPIVGGHEIPVFSDLKVGSNGSIVINTWGGSRIMTAAALARFCDQATAIISPSAVGPGKTSVSGFDAEQMAADIAATQGA
jgi:hypothetical protein